MYSNVPMDSYEQQLAELDQTVRATNFLQVMTESRIARDARNDAYRAHRDAEDIKLSIIGTGAALYEVFDNEFSQVSNEIEKVGDEINSVKSAVWDMDYSINRLGQAFIAQLQQSEVSNAKRYDEIKTRVDQVVTTLSNISLQMVTQNEILLDGVRLQKEMFSNIISSIDSLNETAKNPIQTQARELFNRALHSYSRQLLTEAHDDFMLAIEKNKTEPMAHFFLGKIFLYGINDEENLINYDKAIDELKLALRYTKPDINKERQIALLYAEISKHLAKAYYLKRKLEEVFE